MTTALYELALMGSATAEQIKELEHHLSEGIEPFGFKLGEEVAWSCNANTFKPSKKRGAALAYFGATGSTPHGLNSILQEGIPVIPVVSDFNNVHIEIPPELKKFNCISYRDEGAQRIATALLECAGLLPKQRKIFLSYRRTEAREAALQLFSELSARRFDVFLDTHGVAPADDFQAMLWHRLCDSDVLVMLDTKTYFDSRWTKAEFGRAQLKGISILRVGWPRVKASPRTATASQLALDALEVNTEGRLADDVISRICTKIESLRSQSHAVRQHSLFSQINQGIAGSGGTISGVGQHHAIFAQDADGDDIALYPTVGVPTSLSLNEAAVCTPDSKVAVVYDELGMHVDWVKHLAWLNSNIDSARYIKAHKVGWAMTDWEDRQ